MVSGFTNREITTMCDKQQKVTTDLKNGTWTFDEALLQFNRYCVIKNLREKTIKDYQEAYGRFVSFLQQYTVLSVVGELTKRHVEDYIIHLKGTGMKDTSVNTCLRGIRVILNFLSEQEACIRIKVPMQKTDKMIKETYLAILDITKKWTGTPHNWMSTANRLMIYFEGRIVNDDLIV